jgi:hypothetical protein
MPIPKIELSKNTFVPKRYVPKHLSLKDKKKQRNYLSKSRTLYKHGIYYSRPKVASYKHISSPHIRKAMQIYGVENLKPTPILAKKTGCTLKSLEKIVNKGRGAYYSSGSRPNQTAESWGIARLASSVTGGNASLVDYHILEEGCNPHSKALAMARKTRKMRKHK